MVDGLPERYVGNFSLSIGFVNFNSLAFICAGLGEAVSSDLAENYPSSASKAVTSSIASSASVTPLAPSVSMTSPRYMAPAGSSLPGSVPINTASSGIAPSAGSTASPFTPSFTSGAPRLGKSVAGGFVVLGGAMLL